MWSSQAPSTRTRTLFSDVYRPVVLRSLGLAALAVVLCAVVGVPAALAASTATRGLHRVGRVHVEWYRAAWRGEALRRAM